MTHLKHVLLALSLSTIVTLAPIGTAGAIGTKAYQPDILDRIAKVHDWQPIQEKKPEPKVAVVTTPLPAPPAPTPLPTPVPTPAPVVDPNGCEAKGQRYRADNNECIPQPAPAHEQQSQSASYAPAPANGGPNCELARSLINQYSWNTEVAYNVMVQESGCNPVAANWTDNHGACVGSFGLFQMNCTLGQLYDPVANVAAAYKMWTQSGWQGWSFTTCKKVACY